MTYKLAYSSWGNEEIEAINRVVDSGYFSMGSEVKAFEKAFAKKIGREYAVMVNSGSSANLLAVMSLNMPVSYEVVLPRLGWSTTYSPFHFLGHKMHLFNVDHHTYNIDLTELEKYVKQYPEIRAICVVNVLGNPCDFTKIRDICDRYQLFLIEDNCEGLGATYKGKQCGTFGDVSTFSFFFSHHIQTMEGGMIVTDNKVIYERILAMRAHGWTRELPDDNHFGVSNKEQFKFVIPGFNMRPTEMSGAIGLSQLKKWDRFIDVRRENAETFKKMVDANYPVLWMQQETEHSSSSWFGFGLVDDFGDMELILHLNSKGIETRPLIAGDINEQPVYMNYYRHNSNSPLFGGGKYSAMASLHTNGFFVGNANKCLRKKIKNMGKVIDKYCNQNYNKSKSREVPPDDPESYRFVAPMFGQVANPNLKMTRKEEDS